MREGGASEAADFDLTVVDLGLDSAGVFAVDGAADGDGGSENLLDGAGEVGSVGLGAHLLGDFNNVVELDLAVVDGVLNLLSVTWGLFECLEQQGRCGGQHGHKALSVLDHNLNVNLDSFPREGGLLDVFADLLGGQTEGTALGGERGGGGDLTTNYLQVDVLLLVGVNRCFGWQSS